MKESRFEIRKYTPDHKLIWDDFVESSKNGTFLFNRGYMDYHSDRFEDNSFLIYYKDTLYCLLPACKIGDVVHSHAGLTYGGLVMGNNCRASEILKVFNLLTQKLREEGFSRFIYKAIPHIYHKLPSEEDLYALFRNSASLKSRNISSVVYLEDMLPFSQLRRRKIKLATKEDVRVEKSEDYEGFWRILEKNLSEKFGVNPVHTLDEIKYLAKEFPDNIKLFVALKEERILGGIVCYFTSETLHLQYISAGKEGKDCGAIDLIIDYLLFNESNGYRYFDFGTSNEDGGWYLNENLIRQKEGFGARAVCYDTYEIIL